MWKGRLSRRIFLPATSLHCLQADTRGPGVGGVTGSKPETGVRGARHCLGSKRIWSEESSLECVDKLASSFICTEMLVSGYRIICFFKKL